jgi:bifunctional ADP-heptose synthase (sugar kinase/adenylyltransferase)
MTGAPEAARRFLDGFAARHSAAEVLAGLSALRPLRVLVVGEAIIDEYSYCTPLGKAPKDPIVSARHVRLERHAGGALACANHVAGFCDDVQLVTCLGADDQDAFVRQRLRPNVTAQLFVRDGAPTIVKRRYVSEATLVKMFEVAVMDDTPPPGALEERMLAHLDAALPLHDLVIAADYGHGLLGPRAAGLLAEGARVLAVNTQANPGNLGFNVITKYPRAAHVCLDEAELRLALRDRFSPVTELADAVRELLKCSVVSVTRGAAGVLVSGANEVRWEVPALARAVVDRMGAGDAYLAVASPAVAAGLPVDVAALLGSAAAALAVETVGNRTSVDAAAVRRLVGALLA